MPTIAADAFTRTVSGGWGTADSGGAYTATNGTYFSVNGTLGLLAITAGNTAYARLAALSTTAADVLVSVKVGALPNSGNLYAYVHARSLAESASSSTSYGAIVQVAAAGTVSAIVRVNGTGILSSGTLPGITAAAGTVLWVRVRVSGTNPTTISAKVWADGTSEPSPWSVATTDTTAGLQTAGAVAFGSYLSSIATNGPITTSWDNVTVTDVSGVPPTVNAGSDVTATTGSSTALSGTVTANGGATISSIQWTCTTYPGGTAPTITGATSASASFTPAASGTYVFQLSATDSNSLTSTDTVTVTAASTATPTVNLTVNTNVAVIDATTSTPGTPGDALTYTISPTTGTSQPATGIFLVPLPTAATTYTVTATDSTTSAVSAGQIVVPAGTSYTGSLISLTLPTPLDPGTNDTWASLLNGDLATLQNAVNGLVAFYNQNVLV